MLQNFSFIFQFDIILIVKILFSSNQREIGWRNHFKIYAVDLFWSVRLFAEMNRKHWPTHFIWSVHFSITLFFLPFYGILGTYLIKQHESLFIRSGWWILTHLHPCNSLSPPSGIKKSSVKQVMKVKQHPKIYAILWSPYEQVLLFKCVITDVTYLSALDYRHFTLFCCCVLSVLGELIF